MTPNTRHAWGHAGTVERPLRADAEGEELLYPSPLAFVPAASYDAEEFADALHEHDEIFARQAETLFALLRGEAEGLRLAVRRAACELGDLAVEVSMHDAVGVLASRGGRDRVRLAERKQLVHALSGCRGIQRRLILAPGGAEMYVVIATPGALSLRSATLGDSDSAERNARRSTLVAGRPLVVEPGRSKTRPFGPLAVTWAPTPRAFLRVHVCLRPLVPTAPEAEMDGLMDVYGPELRAQWRSARGESLASISSTRACGDHAIVASRMHPMWPITLERYANVSPIVSQPAPSGWLPVVVRTDAHVGLRWLDRSAGRSTSPANWPAEVVPWKRVRLVENA